jgi:hypothetical protein
MAEVKALLTALVHEALQELSETKVVPAEGQAPTHDADGDDPCLADGPDDADDRGPEHR